MKLFITNLRNRINEWRSAHQYTSGVHQDGRSHRENLTAISRRSADLDIMRRENVLASKQWYARHHQNPQPQRRVLSHTRNG